MAPTVTIELAGRPLPKLRPRSGPPIRTKEGRVVHPHYTPAATRQNEDALRYAAQVAMAGRPPLTGPVAVNMTVLLPPLKSWSKKVRADALSGLVRPCTKPDIDNYLKAAMDACNAVVFLDDNQVVELQVRKLYSDRPATRIEVTALELRAVVAPVLAGVGVPLFEGASA